jgi:hypothetical protein
VQGDEASAFFCEQCHTISFCVIAPVASALQNPPLYFHMKMPTRKAELKSNSYASTIASFRQRMATVAFAGLFCCTWPAMRLVERQSVTVPS